MTATMTPPKAINAEKPVDANDRPDRRLLVGYLHKTSNTLCGIKGYASLIADRENAAGEAGAWARKIIAEVERMEEIFRSVGDLTRGRRHPDVGIDLPGLVHDLAKDFSTNRPELRLHVGSIPEADLLVPVADLVLMISEILNNCAECGAGVAAEVRAECDPSGKVVLTIEDDGEGMEPELIPQAASPFVTTREGHIGVGLTRVDTLIEMYGLAWSIDSEAGRGTTVRLEIGEVC